MDEIKKWAFSICCAAITGGIINMILPKGNLQKTFKTVFCVFFLSVIIYPISGTELKISEFSFFESDGITAEKIEENSFIDITSKAAEEVIIFLVNNILEENGVTPKDISVIINILPDGSIDITRFVLSFEKIDNPDLLKEKIFEKAGITPEIIISEEK